VYLPNASATGSIDSRSGGEVTIRWFNPRTGQFQEQRARISRSCLALGEPPAAPSDDWVILITASQAGPMTDAGVQAPDAQQGLVVEELGRRGCPGSGALRQHHSLLAAAVVCGLRDHTAFGHARSDPVHYSSASGGGCIEGLPDTRVSSDDPLGRDELFCRAGTGPVARYQVHFNTAGRYYVRARAYSTGSEDNSVHFGIDGTCLRAENECSGVTARTLDLVEQPAGQWWRRLVRGSNTVYLDVPTAVFTPSSCPCARRV